MDYKEQILMSYLAGVMDGDGSFSLAKRIEHKDRSPLYHPLIQLGSLSERLVEMIKSVFGGSSRLNKAKVGKDGVSRRNFFVWCASHSSQCSVVLDKICNFLVIKKERALFLKDYIVSNPFKRGSNRLSQETLDNREYAYRKMREFNDAKSYSSFYCKKQAAKSTDNELFWSYLAGLIDTDGSLSIRRNKAQMNDRNYRYCPMIQLSMNDIRGLNFIKENCPFGNFKIFKARTCVTGFTNKWAVQSRNDVIAILERIIPYLYVKQENAKILLDFCKNYVSVAHRQASIPQEEVAFREKRYQDLVHMNKYGVYKPSLIDLEAHNLGDRAEAKAP